jgi:hypothetical protein
LFLPGETILETDWYGNCFGFIKYPLSENNVNNKLKSGVIAGFVATSALTALILLKMLMGVMTLLDIARILGDALGMPLFAGWVAHFMLGSLWGLAFGAFYPRIPGRGMTAKGATLGVVAWLFMAVIVTPMAGLGFMGLHAGLMAPVLMLILYLVFGLVLGTSFVAIYSELSGFRLSSASSSTLYHR